MKKFLPFALHSIGQDEIREVVDTLKSNWITTGPKAKLFEENFANFLGVKYAIAVNSCTAALHLALDAINLQESDLVITSPYTFTATAETIRYFGADPIFADIDERTFNIDPHQIRNIFKNGKKNQKKIKAILPVHFAGQSCDMDPIIKIAKEYNLKVIDDAAHALPTTYKSKLIGNISDLSCFSFYATKTITTGEGGMVATNNETYAKRIQTMRLHGISRDVFNRYNSPKASWFYEVVAPGFKYNMSDISAAIGIHQLKKAYLFQKARERIAKEYNREFNNLDEIIVPHVQNTEDMHSWHLYVIKLKLDKINIDRSDFIKKMQNEGIGTSVHFIPIHFHPYYKKRFRFRNQDFPIANKVYEQVVSLPIYPLMKNKDISRVINSVKKILFDSKKKNNIAV